MAWGKMGSVTATGSTAGQTLSSLSDNKFIQIMAHQIPNASGNVNSLLTFNGDVGSNQYQNRYNDNGASDGTFQYTSMVIASADSVFNRFEVIYVLNIAGEEKLMIGYAVNGEGANATSPPIRTERASKWRNTADPISSIKIAPASNNYVADTNISVLGSDLTPAAAIPFPTNVQVGSRAEITDTRKIYHRIIQEQWLEEGSGAYGGRGVFMGGYSNVIDYITISTLGNAIDFGDLSVSNGAGGGVSDYTRGVIAMGDNTNVMEYITIATTGNATDFGDRTVSFDELAGCSNHTRGIFLGGNSNVLDYITIATTGNAIDFGDRTVNGQAPAACASETRGVFAGGNNSGTVTNVIDYVTIASTGNATDFGDLTQARRHVVGLSNDTRGVFGGGLPSGYTDVIDYITIATLGNATDFGDLLVAGYGFGGTASETRGVFAGGNVGGTQNVIQYITIATEGNTTDFGDLTTSHSNMAGVSDT